MSSLLTLELISPNAGMKVDPASLSTGSGDSRNCEKHSFSSLQCKEEDGYRRIHSNKIKGNG
uniref:Uncharacterized protein n=1 Tax=Megaselia scalaris TaxID=36166 RepID=T1GML1_MEGSC